MGLITGIEVALKSKGTYSGSDDDLFLGVVTEEHGGQEWNLSKTASGEYWPEDGLVYRKIGRFQGGGGFGTKVARGSIELPLDAYSGRSRPKVYLRKQGDMDREVDNALRISYVEVTLISDPFVDPAVTGGTDYVRYAAHPKKALWLSVEWGLTVWLPKL